MKLCPEFLVLSGNSWLKPERLYRFSQNFLLLGFVSVLIFELRGTSWFHSCSRKPGFVCSLVQSHKFTKLQSQKVAKLQSHKLSKLQSHKVAKSKSYKVTKFQSHKASKVQSHQVAKS